LILPSYHINIREAVFHDIKLIQELMQQVWPQTYAPIISANQIRYMIEMMYSTESLQNQMKNGHHFWIIEINQTPMGYGSFSRTENWNTYKIHKIYILKEGQREGLGTALLNKFLHIIKSNHGKHVQLQVNRQNKQAIAFYEKNEFKVVKSVDFDLGNDYFMNDYIMQKTL